jgi:hypothetical protein
MLWILILIFVYDVNIYINCIDTHRDGFDKANTNSFIRGKFEPSQPDWFENYEDQESMEKGKG